MKSVLISIRPQWCEKIMSREKTIEVRKTAPKEVPFKAYIYETKESKMRYLNDRFNSFLNNKSHYTDMGKVIGEFICDKVDEYTVSHYEAEYRVTHVEQKAMCLNQPELIQYGKGKTLYGWHISDLKIYDKPKELSEFRRVKVTRGHIPEGVTGFKKLLYSSSVMVYSPTRPPQSWFYVEELK